MMKFEVTDEKYAYLAGLYMDELNISSKSCLRSLDQDISHQKILNEFTRLCSDGKQHDLVWHMLRGFTETQKVHGDEIVLDNKTTQGLVSEFLKGKIIHTIDQDNIVIRGHSNIIDFLSKLYDNSSELHRRTKYYQKYVNLSQNEATYLCQIPVLKFTKTLKEAVTPTKQKASDEGYDLTIVKLDKIVSAGSTTRYDTGIAIEPPAGFYTQVVARSSLSNSGYILSNSVGIIDSSYRGPLKIALTKVDPNAKELQLPMTVAQLILCKSNHYVVTVTDQVSETVRGSGGFGSTTTSSSVGAK